MSCALTKSNESNNERTDSTKKKEEISSGEKNEFGNKVKEKEQR